MSNTKAKIVEVGRPKKGNYFPQPWLWVTCTENHTYDGPCN